MRLLSAAVLITTFVFSTQAAEGQIWLEVELVDPDPSSTTNVIQNETFEVNATVFCRGIGLNCGSVNGTVRYNLTSNVPDTPINTTVGDVPLYINETPASATKTCATDPLAVDQFCNLTWVVNVTGNQSTSWDVGVLFESDLIFVEDNHTDNATISIVGCTVDFTLHWSSIEFGALNPNTENNSAPGNAGNEYNITVNDGSCETDLYVRSTDMVNLTLGRNITASNISWSNISGDIADGFFQMSRSSQLLNSFVQPGQNVTTWFWLNVPATYAGIYNATIYFIGVVSGDPVPP